MTEFYDQYIWVILPMWLLAAAYSTGVSVYLSTHDGPRLSRVAGYIVACYCLLCSLSCTLRALGEYHLARDVCDGTTLWSLFGVMGVAAFLHRWRKHL